MVFFRTSPYIFNPVNKTNISSIRIDVTDGLRRPIYLNQSDTAFSLILKKFLMGGKPPTYEKKNPYLKLYEIKRV